VHFLDADRLAGKGSAEVNLFVTETDPAAVGDHHDFVVEGIVDIGQAQVGAGGGLINLGRTLHAQGFVRTLVVEDVDKVIELGLLLQEV
jgi:hypothetical protein